MNHHLAVQALDEFHPEFYFTVATVLPLLLLVTNLVRVYLGRSTTATAKVGLRLWVIQIEVAATSPRVVAVSMACINVAAEITCLIVLFLRRAGTITSVIIWAGVGCALAWTLLLLSIYINVEATPKQRDGPGNRE